MCDEFDAWRRRIALRVAAELPDCRDDALAVLDYVRELVDGFLAGADARLAGAAVLPFPAKRPAAASLADKSTVSPPALPMSNQSVVSPGT